MHITRSFNSSARCCTVDFGVGHHFVDFVTHRSAVCGQLQKGPSQTQPRLRKREARRYFGCQAGSHGTIASAWSRARRCLETGGIDSTSIPRTSCSRRRLQGRYAAASAQRPAQEEQVTRARSNQSSSRRAPCACACLRALACACVGGRVRGAGSSLLRRALTDGSLGSVPEIAGSGAGAAGSGAGAAPPPPPSVPSDNRRSTPHVAARGRRITRAAERAPASMDAGF